MFRFYPSIPVEPILDATYNAGRFWRGSAWQVVSMDMDPKYKPMIVADNHSMAGVEDASFGVVVYDPPHVGPQGRDKSCKRFDVDFGATMPWGASENWTAALLLDHMSQRSSLRKTWAGVSGPREYNPLSVEELGRIAVRKLMEYPSVERPPA